MQMPVPTWPYSRIARSAPPYDRPTVQLSKERELLCVLTVPRSKWLRKPPSYGSTSRGGPPHGQEPRGATGRNGTAPAQLTDVEGYPPAPVPPETSGVEQLRRAAARCQACDLYRNATQTVFGEGAERAWLMLVGEQPGDREDQTGAPFVGPAGEMLDRALEEAGIDRRTVYVTNVVKHFKWKPRGKRRIHQKPNREEIDACRPWLDAELRHVRPRAIVCLGATAAQALINRSFRVTQQHGVLQPSPVGPPIAATVHPSSVLRAPDSESRRAAYAGLVADLERIAAAVRG
jgi:uracil-DNA glycosylase